MDKEDFTCFHEQDFERLKDEALQKKKLFEDPHFPADKSSLGYKILGPESKISQHVTWKRPKDIVDDPQFIVKGASRFDLCQGRLGDCWFLAAIASLTLDKKLFSRIVPLCQSFSKDWSYAGIFRFRFWRYGVWFEVVIDDQLPTINNKLLFVKSREKNEFWGALLEKAYAKVCGSYEALRAGHLTEALVDFTGGVKEHIKLIKPQPDLWSYLHKAEEAGSLMGAATYHSPQLIRRPGAPQLPCWHRRLEAVEFPEEKTAEGLVLGHAYSLTGLEKVQHKGRVVELVRLRNPWGKIEWKGPWSDGSTEWDEIESRARRYLRVKLEDGEFWMTIQDFVRYFKRTDLCHRTPDNISEGRCSNWSLTVFRGKWEAGKTAGGSFRNVATFGKNSQYHLRLLEADNGGLCTLFVCLMQEPRDRQRNRSPYVAIGFAIYKVPKHCVGIKLSSEYLQWVRPAVRIPRYDAYREMSRHCRLPPGSYVIIPSTDEPDIEAQFLLRVFSLKRNYAEEIKEEAPIKVWTQMDNIYLLDIQFDEPFHALFDDAADLDAKGLFNILKKISSKNPDFQKRVISKDTCKKAIIFMDKDLSGKLDLGEFGQFWKQYTAWHKIFEETISTSNGYMNRKQLKKALHRAGYTIISGLEEQVIRQYFDVRNGMHFDDFICCLLHLEALSEAFKLLTRGEMGYPAEREWVKTILFC